MLAPCEGPPPPPAHVLRGGVLSVYVDGSGEGQGGWGVVMVDGGHGTQDRDATHRADFYGCVVLDPSAPPFLGATRATNNTAELTALAEALHISTLRIWGRGPASCQAAT